jgi:hypothetical protein
MGSVTVFCPSCKTAYSEGRCTGCDGNLEDHAPLFHMVCAAYNRSLRLAREGKSERAWTDLATVIPAFPFVDQALRLLFELSLTVREFSTATLAAAWLSPLGNASEKEELHLRITEAIKDDSTCNKDSDRDVGAPATMAAANRVGRRSRVAYGLLIVLVLVISASATVLGVKASRREEALIAELDATTTQHNKELTRASATVDSLQVVVLELSERISSTPVVEYTSDRIWQDRVESWGPHHLYRKLGLNDPNSTNRLPNMEAFVELFPEYEAYTGPFLRELYDKLKTEDPERANAYAHMLGEYCRQFPTFAKVLISSDIEQLLGQEKANE